MYASMSGSGWIFCSISLLASSLSRSATERSKSSEWKKKDLLQEQNNTKPRVTISTTPRINQSINQKAQVICCCKTHTISVTNSLASCREIQGLSYSKLSNMIIILTDVCRRSLRHKLVECMTVVGDRSWHLPNKKTSDKLNENNSYILDTHEFHAAPPQQTRLCMLI
jgi:hypothetical protein